MKTFTRSTLALCTLAALIPGVAPAQDSRNQGYLIGTDGGIIMTTFTGMCVRDSDWTPARAVEPCVPARPVVAQAPPQPAAAPVAAPAAAIPAPAPQPVMTQKVSFSADALFAFDKAVLKPEGMTMLDDLVRQSAGLSYESIVLTGHADRFGTSEYNQKLSERRAQAVKDYLVGKNIQAGRIEVEGKGETQPMTAAGACDGARSARVIACLQPDRRVDVEMTGTRGTPVGSR